MNKRNLILEIGTEELPAAPLQAAIAKLADQAAQALEEQRLEHGDIQALATPRRIILKVDDLVEASEAQVQSFRGPSAAIAYDEQGAPTKAAQGFARGKGVAVEDLVRKMEGDTEYVYAEVANAAESALDLLPGLLLGLVEGIYWPRSQRWATAPSTSPVPCAGWWPSSVRRSSPSPSAPSPATVSATVTASWLPTPSSLRMRMP